MKTSTMFGSARAAAPEQGFDPFNILSMQVHLSGSGAIDNLHYNAAVIPLPPAVLLGLAGLGGVAVTRRRLSR